MTYTTNYQLPQWVKSDRIMMDDFNDANTKIDAALKSQADALDTLTGQLTEKGNCRITYTTYQGTGQYGQSNPTTLTFTQGEPDLVLVMDFYGHSILMRRGCSSAVNGDSLLFVTWSTSGVSWYSSMNGSSQMSSSGTYYVFLFYILE